jgi:hypothetical protein
MEGVVPFWHIQWRREQARWCRAGKVSLWCGSSPQQRTRHCVAEALRSGTERSHACCHVCTGMLGHQKYCGGCCRVARICHRWLWTTGPLRRPPTKRAQARGVPCRDGATRAIRPPSRRCVLPQRLSNAAVSVQLDDTMDHSHMDHGHMDHDMPGMDHGHKCNMNVRFPYAPGPQSWSMVELR